MVEDLVAHGVWQAAQPNRIPLSGGGSSRTGQHPWDAWLLAVKKTENRRGNGRPCQGRGGDSFTPTWTVLAKLACALAAGS